MALDDLCNPKITYNSGNSVLIALLLSPLVSPMIYLYNYCLLLHLPNVLAVKRYIHIRLYTILASEGEYKR